MDFDTCIAIICDSLNMKSNYFPSDEWNTFFRREMAKYLSITNHALNMAEAELICEIIRSQFLLIGSL